MSISHQRTMRFDTRQYGRIAELASSQGRSVADVVRAAIDQYLLGQSLLTDSQLRLIRVGEYSQLALDTIITEQFPDFRDRIISSTDNRMRRFHGQD